jgi:hypothetical protein
LACRTPSFGRGVLATPTINYVDTINGMDFKLTDLEPKPNDWLDLNVCYEGEGGADFTSPKGSINGLFDARFDEFGGVSIKLSWKNMSYDPDYRGGALLISA